MEQSPYTKSSLERPLQLSFQADLNKKIRTNNKICSQTTKENIDFKDEVIKTQSKKEVIAQTPSVKWGKYLIDTNEENDKNSTATSLTWFPTKSSGFENSEPKNTHFSSKSHENKSNLQKLEKSMTIDANHSFCGLSNQMSKNTSRGKQNLPGVQYFDKNSKITTEQQSFNKQPLVSSQGFECDCNFTDVDFQLDF